MDVLHSCGFGRWLNARGQPDAYILSDQWKASFIRPQPYLLTHEEIEGFFTTAASVDAQSPSGLAIHRLLHAHALGRNPNR